MKKIITVFTMLLYSATCLSAKAQTSTTDEGVEINGVIWATRNVGAPGTFVDNPEDFGEYYQWNKGTSDFLQNNDYYHGIYAGTTAWLPENDPCPCGWRVPTIDEFNSLLNSADNWKYIGNGQLESMEDSWITVDGKKVFLIVSGSDSLFLPGAGVRQLLTYGVLDGTGSGHYWSSTPNGNTYARHLNLMNLSAYTTTSTSNIFRANGHSIRCVKNIPKTIIVTNGADSGEGTLRQAIIDAGDGDKIVFAEDVETITLLTGGLHIDKKLTVNGNENNNPVIKVQTGSTYTSFCHFSIAENTTVTFNNLTLTDGNNLMTCGGAIYNSGNLTVNNCSFINNKAEQSGAIHSAGNSSLIVTNSLFEGNFATSNGGAIATVVKAQLIDCHFKNNTANKGGVIYNGANDSPDERKLNIVNCVFENNTANEGAAIYNNGKCTVTNSLIVENTGNFGAVHNYGFYFLEYTATLTIVNSTLADNNDIGLYIDNNPFTVTEFRNNIFWGNTANDVFVKNNDEAVTASNNLIGEDPLFVDAANGDYSLLENSPAIDAGNNTFLPEGITTDLAGLSRISNNTTVDLGAYEFQQTPIIPTKTIVPTEPIVLPPPIVSLVNNVADEDVKIYTHYRSIIVENTTEPVSIYNVGGQCVMSNADAGSFNMPQAGVYIVKTGSVVQKVVVY